LKYFLGEQVNFPKNSRTTSGLSYLDLTHYSLIMATKCLRFPSKKKLNVHVVGQIPLKKSLQKPQLQEKLLHQTTTFEIVHIQNNKFWKFSHTIFVKKGCLHKNTTTELIINTKAKYLIFTLLKLKAPLKKVTPMQCFNMLRH
jgi:hypothetical protein